MKNLILIFALILLNINSVYSMGPDKPVTGNKQCIEGVVGTDVATEGIILAAAALE